MLPNDLAPTFVGRLGIVVVVADVVGAHRPVVVGVGLAIRDRIEFVKRLTPSGIEDPQQQFILRRVVSFGLRKRHAVLRMIRQAGAETIRLDLRVAGAVFARRLGADAGQQAARRVAGNDGKG